MSKNKAVKDIKVNPAIKAPSQKSVTKEADSLRASMAIGVVIISITISLLYLVNNFIYNNYHPDVKGILDQVLPLTIAPAHDFFPEPVERMQFQVSLLLAPIIILLSYFLLRAKSDFFRKNGIISLIINISGILLFAYYLSQLFMQPLLYVQNETNTYFFVNNLITVLNTPMMFLIYLAMAFLMYLYVTKERKPVNKIIVNIISYVIVLVVVIDIFMNNIFHEGLQEWGRMMETNAVFYSVVQVYAGKSLLVNINSQYGLYAWFLCPVFKIIGLTTYKFAVVMGILNASAYFMLYLGIKRIIKQDILSLIVFLSLTYWQYWLLKIPLEATAHPYYQYFPIRTLFAYVLFYLIVVFQTTSQRNKKWLLPILTITAAMGILWNMDTGLVVFGATYVAIIASVLCLDASLKEKIKMTIINSAWMFGSLAAVILLFIFTTKIHAGTGPDFQQFAAFQKVFYISGFFMLPMTGLHFWNLPIFVYLIACVYCVFYLWQKNQTDMPVVAFLFILGMGIFAYFQGRSYDTNIDVVMYPAIILVGIFANKLLIFITSRKIQPHESIALFLPLFIFLADGAFSMLYYTPMIHSYTQENAFLENPEKEKPYKKRLEFISQNLHPKDTVLILAKDYDSYYYASGNYYNPLHIPGSTELFFKSEISSLLNFIKTDKYPIIYDANHTWLGSDSIISTLAKYTTIEKQLENDATLILLKPRKKQTQDRLAQDANTVYYNNLGAFSKYINPTTKVNLPENFTVEFYMTLDTAAMIKNDLIFSNTMKNPFHGFFMSQYGDDKYQYLFTYGNGATWCNGAQVRFNYSGEYHIVIQVRKNLITVYNNNAIIGQGNTNSNMLNSDGVFFINPSFKGLVSELKVENQ